MLRQIVYVSTAARLSEADLADILDSANRNNAQHRITGFLLYNERNFLQLIEGEPGDLRVLMQKLYKDTRHSGIVVLEDNPIAERAFPDWHMEHLSWATKMAERREMLEAGIDRLADPRIRQTVLNFASLN